MNTESEADPQAWAPTCTVILALSPLGCKPRKGSQSQSDLWLCFVLSLCKTGTTTYHNPTGSLASCPHYPPFGSLHSRCRGFSATRLPRPPALLFQKCWAQDGCRLTPSERSGFSNITCSVRPHLI